VKVELRLIIAFLVRLAFLVFAGCLVVLPDLLPGAHFLVRMGLAVVFVGFAYLWGEVVKLQTQFEMLLKALRAAGAQVRGEAPPRDDNAAIAILIRALGSREESTREKAHANLVRITGRDLPPEREAWEAWWKERQREAGAEPGAGTETSA